MSDYWKAVVISVTGFVATITAITILNNLELFAGFFCGSLQDFGNEVTHTGCISFKEYWLRAAVHWPYTLAATLIGVGMGWAVENYEYLDN